MPNNDTSLKFIEGLMSGSIPGVVWTILFTIIFLYIIIYSFFQVRQLRVLQDRVRTAGDSTMTLLSYLYLLIQVLIFVVTLLIL